MRFTLIDRITELRPNESITAVKSLSLAEDYLADHFPLFPVMPGVLMLESMYQAGAWLVRRSEDFAHSLILLKEARNVKYADFVKPGQVLTVKAQITKQDDQHTWLKAWGEVNGNTAVSGRLILERFNLAIRRPERALSDPLVTYRLREEFAVLYQPTAASETIA